MHLAHWGRDKVGNILQMKYSNQLYRMKIFIFWFKFHYDLLARVQLINSLRPSDAYRHSDNGLSPGRCQAIIWTNAGILLIGPLGANFGEILIEILTFWFKNMRFKVSSVAAILSRPQLVNNKPVLIPTSLSEPMVA